MKKQFLLLAVSFALTTTSSNAQTWNNVGIPGFSIGGATYTTMVIDSSGVPYVAYEDSVNGNKATVMKYNGIAWVAVGTPGFSPGAAIAPSLAIDNSGTLYVAFQDGADTDNASVMKYNGSSWVFVGAEGFGSELNYLSIAIDAAGIPYVAGAHFGLASVLKFNGFDWVPVGIQGFSAGATQFNSISIAPDGTPYVIFADATVSYKNTVMKYVDTVWQIVGTPGISTSIGSISVGLRLSIKFDGGGTPYVSYSNGYEGPVTVNKFDGTNWELVGNITTSSDFVSLAIGSGGEPYVAFCNVLTHKANVLKYVDTSWIVQGSADFTPGWTATTSMALDNSGNIYVAYKDEVTDGKASVMKLDASTKTGDVLNVTTGSVAVFPDPNSGLFTLRISTAGNEPAAIKITNILGEIVKDFTAITNVDIPVEIDTYPGIYFISASTKNNCTTTKILVQ